MEELLAVVVQFVLELLFQVLVSGAVEVGAVAWSRRDKTGCGWLVGQGLLGGLFGWLSTLLFPHLMLPFLWLRILNLALAPLAAGGMTFYMDKWWNKGTDGSAAFWHGFTFALLFGLARFAFAAR